jgi:hypothetical protein
MIDVVAIMMGFPLTVEGFHASVIADVAALVVPPTSRRDYQP